MSAEEDLKYVIGNLVVDKVFLQAEVERLKTELAAARAKQPEGKGKARNPKEKNTKGQ